MTSSDTSTKVLVTGGAGFLGSNLIARLNHLGYTDITIVDRLGSGSKWRNLVGLQYARFMDVEAFAAHRRESCCMYDVVILLGACSSTRELDMSYLARNNVNETVETIEWARAGRQIHSPSGSYTIASNARIVYASSAATYGSGAASDDLSPSVLHPLNPYGLSKNMVDQALEARGLLTSTVGLKYFNVFGPNCEHKGVMESFVTRAYREIKTTGKVTMFDTYKDVPEGQDARDFLWVGDAVDVTIHFALGDGRAANGLFNVGSGVATTWLDMATYTFNAMGRATQHVEILSLSDGQVCAPRTVNDIIYKPLAPELRGKYQYYTRADISKLRATGYAKWMTPANEAVKLYVRDYLVPDLRVGERFVTKDLDIGR